MFGLRKMIVGLLAASSWGSAAAASFALDTFPEIPFAWDFTPGRNRNGRSRSPGGRAHRRWRIARAAGRR